MTELHLIRLECGKLFRSRTFLITVLVFLISICSTFIALSQSSGFAESMTTQIPDLSFLEPGDAEDLAEAMQSVFSSLLDPASELAFPQALYITSNGTYAVVLIFATVHVLADFSYGTAQNVLLCGYSRRQYYTAKLISSFLGGCLYLSINMVVFAVIGCVFYGNVLGMAAFTTLALVLLAQFVVVAQHVAIYTGFAFLFRNGWSFAASAILLFLLPGIPLAQAFMTGANTSYLLSIVPTYISLSGVSQLVTVDQMAAMPTLWTPGYVASVFAVAGVIISAMTVSGMRSYDKQNL